MNAYLAIDLPGDCLALKAQRARTAKLGPNLKLAPNRPPIRYVLAATPESINDIAETTWNAHLYQINRGEEAIVVRMKVPADVRAMLAKIGFDVNPEAEVELPSYLRWKEESGESPKLGYVVLPNEIPVDEQMLFYPDEEVRVSRLPQPRVLISLFSINDVEAKDTFQLACDMAYYLAKASLLSNTNYQHFSHVHMLAQIYALSVQHQFGAKLIEGGFMIVERNGFAGIKAKHDNRLVRSWFDGNHRMWSNIDKVIQANADLRQEIKQGLEIKGTITAARVIDQPVVVTAKLLVQHTLPPPV